MKAKHPKVSTDTLVRLFGYRRQAWYQACWRQEEQAQDNHQVLEFVHEQRKDQPRIGGKKLYKMIKDSEEMAQISMGRDAFFALLRENGLLIRQRKKYRPATTDGNGQSIYPDFRKGLIVNRINQLWSSDITYIHLAKEEGFAYATFVVDEYSHLIVGYSLTKGMTAEEVRSSLERAVESQLGDRPHFDQQLTFHTDRGSQFKSAHFQKLHSQYQIRKSMCEQGKSSENPVSERLNGILKHELLIEEEFDSFDQAQHAIDRAVRIYNHKRPHSSIEMMTPQQAHQQGQGPLKKLWRQRKKKQPTAQGPSHSGQADSPPTRPTGESPPQQPDVAKGLNPPDQRHSHQVVEVH
jgi:transposase InsO family protein